MKQRFFRIALLALAVATTACSKSELDNIPTPAPVAGERISVTATIAGSEQTRVSLTPATEGSNPIVKVDWKASGEKFAVINGEATTTFEQTSGNNFEGTLPAGAASYVGIYPATAAGDNNKIIIDLAQQTGELDESKTYMLSTRTTDGSSYSFSHVTALLRPTFKVDDEELSNALISKVVVRNTTTARSINLFGGTTPADTTGDITVTRTPSGDDIYIYLCKGYTAGETIDVWVNAPDGDTDKWYSGNITVPYGKSLTIGNLYTPTIALVERDYTPATITYTATQKASIATGFGVEGHDYTHTFENGTGTITPNIGNNWTAIPSEAFYYNSNITSVTLHSTITAIGANAFKGCSNLASINLSNVQTIGNNSFDACSSLTSVDLSSATSLGKYCFNKCSNLETVDLSSNVTLLNEACFCSCSKLRSIDLSKVQTFDRLIFADCSSLISVDLSSATLLRDSCFQGCTALISVTLGEDISTLGYGVFDGCNELEHVLIRAITPPTLYDSTFRGCHTDLKISVHPYALEDYRTAWGGYVAQDAGNWGTGVVEEVIVVTSVPAIMTSDLIESHGD